MRRVLVTGAGGFIGSHLVTKLKSQGAWVRGVDLKKPEFSVSAADEFIIADLREQRHATRVQNDINDVYHLAADMGGIGYITKNLTSISFNNSRINLNMLEGAAINRVQRYLYTSSACVYPHGKQQSDVPSQCALREEDAYPAQPEPGYGWEKLYAEQLTDYVRQECMLDTRIVRFHNVYGPLGTYDGGKEKSPAALCRKVADMPVGGEVEVWGDGEQVRSYMYIDDCVEGLLRIMHSGYQQPINLGTEEAVTINDLAYLIGSIADKAIHLKHVDGPQGVRGRNSDNTLLRKITGWEPQTSLGDGLVPTYRWINLQVNG